MIATDLFSLLPIITLTGVILVVMMVIAFARNLALTCLCSSIGLALTLRHRLGRRQYRTSVCDATDPD